MMTGRLVTLFVFIHNLQARLVLYATEGHSELFHGQRGELRYQCIPTTHECNEQLHERPHHIGLVDFSECGKDHGNVTEFEGDPAREGVDWDHAKNSNDVDLLILIGEVGQMPNDHNKQRSRIVQQQLLIVGGAVYMYMECTQKCGNSREYTRDRDDYYVFF
eukprot:GEZU01016407.1.p1 GENE.GEZU01016407.1~~GEZU01016407.1.p1  ORF type:complete len:162 (+),score=1.54 GEZU01016407.1:25-510(+)